MNLLNLTTTEITLFNTICLIKDIKKINNDCFEMVCYAPLIDNKGKEIGYVDIYIPCVTKEGICLPISNFNGKNEENVYS